MSLTAKEVQEVGFEHSLRGYDVEQVDVFLERVATEVDALNNRIAELEEELAQAQDAAQAASGETTGELGLYEADDTSKRLEETQAELEKAQAKASDALIRLQEEQQRARNAEDRAKRAEAQVEPLQQKLDEKNEMDNAISQALIVAQRSADLLKEEAQQEGERIYRESEAKAREFIREALSRKASINAEADALRNSVDAFRDEYQRMLARYTNEAANEFRNMPALEVLDEEVNVCIPDIESMQGVEIDTASDTGNDSASHAHFDRSAFPQIEPEENTGGDRA